MLPPELGIDSDRIVEIGRLQDLDQWNKLFVGGGGDQVLPAGLTSDSARVFRIDGVQNIAQWAAIYAAAAGDDVLPATLFSNSSRVFESLQTYRTIGLRFMRSPATIPAHHCLRWFGRVFQIDSLQAFNSWADLYEVDRPRMCCPRR